STLHTHGTHSTHSLPPPTLTLFFFQAEDGIRDLIVTGVQTCALPIYPSSLPVLPLLHLECVFDPQQLTLTAPGGPAMTKDSKERSEERRVGEEGRWRWVGWLGGRKEVEGWWWGTGSGSRR